MKAVLLAGGLGTRMREQTDLRPKPMVEVGGRPVLWHIMKWLSSWGLNDFVVLTGYKSDYIKQYFANYRINNFDFSVKLGDPNSIEFFGSHDENNWSVTILDTGLNTPTGGRIKAAQEFLGNQRFFLTYGDGIADVNIKELISSHESSSALATVTVSKAVTRFGAISTNASGMVTSFVEKPVSKTFSNIGYFIFEPGVMDFLTFDDALETGPLRTLADNQQLNAYSHEGFWQPMDTQREYEILTDLWESGKAPWALRSHT